MIFFRRIVAKYSFELFVSLRYITSAKKTFFLSFITLLSVFGVALGVFAMIVVLSVMGGFEEDLKNKMLLAEPHITVSAPPPAWLDNADQLVEKITEVLPTRTVKGGYPFIGAEMVLESQKRLTATETLGVDLSSWSKVSDIPNKIIEGDINLLDSDKGELQGIILGERLAEDLVIGIGDIVNLISPTEYEGPLGLAPKSISFIVVGIFSTELFHIDSTYSFVSMQQLSRFLSVPDNMISGVNIKVDDPYKTTMIVSKLKEALNSESKYEIRDWQERNSALFSALSMEKFAMALILLITVLVSSFSIVTTIYLMVIEKTASISVLKALGASKRAIARLFIIEGGVIGFLGTTVGFTIGILFLILLDKYKFIPLPSGVYHVDQLPVEFLFSEYSIICSASFLLCILAAIFPAWKASSLEPVSGFRYE